MKSSEIELLRRFSAWLTENLGLHFPEGRVTDLERGIREACSEFGFTGPGSCMEGLMSRPLTRERSEILARYLTVGETYFFREPKVFAALDHQVLPDLIGKKEKDSRVIRIWSAGCATGEEPYSIAILLFRLLAHTRNWKATILATDINPRALKQAANGIYGEWSFRDAPGWVKETCFQSRGRGRYELLPEIRDMVSFGYLNLAEDVYPALVNNTSALDLVVCRNVLMYFLPATARQVLHKFSLAIVEGGWMCISPCDTFHFQSAEFVPAGIPDVSFFRKRPPRSRSIEPADPEHAFRSPTLRLENESEVPRDRRRPPPAPRIESALTRASELLGQGRYTEAAEAARQYLGEHPDHSTAIEVLARAAANQGQLGEALDWCQKGLARDRLNWRLQFLSATILQEQVRLEEALISLKQVIYLQPDFVLAHFALGTVSAQLGRATEAQGHFRRALELLEALPQEQLVPESEGMTAGRLHEIIRSTQEAGIAT